MATKRPAAETKLKLRPDHWERFERAVDIAVKTPAVHKRPPRNYLPKSCQNAARLVLVLE